MDMHDLLPGTPATVIYQTETTLSQPHFFSHAGCSKLDMSHQLSVFFIYFQQTGDVLFGNNQ
jgi:hypothetical protein